jgi:hypothetical protein
VSDPVPQRIGDAERDRAAEYLREHMSVGRLTQDEFDDRLTAALQAKTTADLEPLFADLPAPRPGQPEPSAEGTPWPLYQVPPARTEMTPAPAGAPAQQSGASNFWNIAAAVAWPACILLCFAIGWQYWWLLFVPIVISSISGQRRQEQRRLDRRRPPDRRQLP